MSKLTADHIRQIRQALTWGDNHHARKEAGKDADSMDILAHQYHRAARRLGIVPADQSLDDFLDSLDMDTLAEGMQDAEGEEANPTKSGRG